jgi:hypothetical protein
VDRIDPRSGVPVNCINCRHFDPETLYSCAAYPDGIPIPVLSGDIQHDQPLLGDNGIQFVANYTTDAKVDSNLKNVSQIISKQHKISVDAILGEPRRDSESVSGYFRSGYNVYFYRYDNLICNIEALPNVSSQAFLRGYYVPDLSPYLPDAYVMGMVDAAIAKESLRRGVF